MAHDWKQLQCFLLAALFLVSGCAAAPSETRDSSKSEFAAEHPDLSGEENLSLTEQLRVYPIELTPGKQWLVDRTGKTISAEAQSALIYDQLTRKPQYKVKTRRFLSGKTDEYGQPVYTNQSALFSLDDQCLAEWDDVIYEGGMGDLVIRRDYADEFDSMMDLPEDYQTALIDGRTQTVIQAGVFQQKAVDEVSLIALDKDRRLLGVVDANGQVISGFPAAQTYYDPEAAQGRIVASSVSFLDNEARRTDTLLDIHLNPLYSAPRINTVYKGLHGSYFIIYQKNRTAIVSVETLEPVYEIDPELEFTYFDGERLLVYLEDEKTGEETMCLWDRNNRTLFEAEVLISAQPQSSKDRAGQFLAAENETAMLISREGQVLKRQTIPGLTSLYCDREGLYFYEAYNEKGQIRTGLLDEELRIVIPAEAYETLSVATLQDYLIEPMDYLLAVRRDHAAELTDILDLKGNVIFSGATRIYSRGQDRFALLQGEFAGLINGQGEWIVKRSIYSLGWDD